MPTALASGAIALEAVVLAVNRLRCPLTGLAERRGAESGRVTDIFLPGWFAPHVFSVCGALCVLGFAAVAVRFVR